MNKMWLWVADFWMQKCAFSGISSFRPPLVIYGVNYVSGQPHEFGLFWQPATPAFSAPASPQSQMCVRVNEGAQAWADQNHRDTMFDHTFWVFLAKNEMCTPFMHGPVQLITRFKGWTSTAFWTCSHSGLLPPIPSPAASVLRHGLHLESRVPLQQLVDELEKRLSQVCVCVCVCVCERVCWRESGMQLAGNNRGLTTEADYACRVT